jgi:hypothetical protein
VRPSTSSLDQPGDDLLPESVFYILERVAEIMARGDSITVVPVGREITT